MAEEKYTEEIVISKDKVEKIWFKPEYFEQPEDHYATLGSGTYTFLGEATFKNGYKMITYFVEGIEDHMEENGLHIEPNWIEHRLFPPTPTDKEDYIDMCCDVVRDFKDANSRLYDLEGNEYHVTLKEGE